MQKELSVANPKSKGLRYEAGINGVDMDREGRHRSEEWSRASLCRRSTQRNYGWSLQCNGNGVCIKAVRTELDSRLSKSTDSTLAATRTASSIVAVSVPGRGTMGSARSVLDQ